MENRIIFAENDDNLPAVSILLAVYNEASVLDHKIKSTFSTSYPLNKIEFLIGSDASTDNSNSIIEHYQNQYPQLKLKVFKGRSGKSRIMNELAELASNPILILTDANVFFTSETIYHLVKHYKNQSIAQVGGNIINPEHKKEGISYQEKSYLSRENRMKYQEGLIWGCMIGAFGGCYSIRKNYFIAVPPHFIVDDFYSSMHVLKAGGKSLNELKATCYEDVSNKIEEEFRRKVRISTGNFQNLAVYRNLLWPPFKGLAFCFGSHKVIRWYGPILLIIALISNLLLFPTEGLLFYSLVLQIVLMISPVLDWLLKKLHIHIKLLRFATHFYLMNLALLLGLIQYLKGVKTSVWQPTQRNQ